MEAVASEVWLVQKDGLEHRFKLSLVARETVEPAIEKMTDKFKLQSLAAREQCCLPLKRVGKTYGFCRVTGYPSLWYFFSKAVSGRG